ncbi:MAG: hypothetical protein QOK19_2182 [Solirubrobacteraceae bacterium]|jgi:hypothetical protein|nr:hypothetical protein [Solirubrobacterales bacterium]MEA2216621.1 hypothetical protein [Solirubrobacteraceae bacterium]
MPRQLFVFVQLEFPWVLGPSDGRYLLRDGPDAEPERVVVVETLGADRAGAELPGPAGWITRRGSRRREQAVEPQPRPAPVATTRVTVIDPVPLSAEGQARAWLEELDRERDVEAAVAIVNRVVHSHRIAAADPYVREVSAAQALVTRAGWGEGEQVASGLWLHARELSLRPRRRGRRRDRSWALRPQERLAALLSGRSRGLLCEELTLRARLDLDQGRAGHAAVGLDRALTAATGELAAENRHDLALRLAELEELRGGVGEQARAVLDGDGAGLDEEVVAHALGRLEAALRARTAAGI